MITLLHSNTANAQSPQLFNYQGIARDVKGNPLANQQMSLKISLLPAADAVQPEYEESHQVTTNEFGLYTLQIGNGTPLNGEMKAVKWETGNKYVKVAIDPKGGNDFVDAGTSQLLSVPYAIYADKAGTAKNAGGGDRLGAVSTSASGTGTVNYLTKFTAANTIYNSQLFDNGTNIGIGTTTPAARLHLYSNVAGVQQQIRMQNASTTGASRFRMDNDGTLSYATFSKYGTAYASGYPGIATLYPYANLLAFGNNGLVADDGLGRFLISNGGNVGLSIFKGGTSKLKFHADYATENVGIGGNAAPVSRVHLNNTDGTSMDLRLTNTTTGHTANDGLEIRNSGNAASIVNKENSTLMFGTNNAARVTIGANGYLGIGTTAPSDDALHIKRSYSSIKLEDSNDNAVLYIVAPDPSTFTTGGIGTSTNHELPFFTNNVERLVMKADGKIGINTNTPITDLHVDGNIKADTIFATFIKDSSHYIGELFGGGIVFHIWKDSNRVEHGYIACAIDGPPSDWFGAQIWCNSLVTGVNCNTCSPWYVPSVVEYSYLERNYFDIKRVLGINGLNLDTYWSSETCCGNGGGKYIIGSHQMAPGFEINTAQHPVRAVRTF
jgi:hypothetical protein